MSHHLSREALIDFKFDLLEGDALQTATNHLDGCADCRKKLEQVAEAFGVLDELQEEYTLSDAAVENLMAQVRREKAGPATVIPFYRRPAALAAAAGLILLLALQPWKQATPPDEVGGIEPVSPVSPPTHVVPNSPTGDQELLALRAERPFPPASAIELNVLPRRDEVQLTIYNSADLTLVREKRKLTLKKGWNWMQFMWANTLIDPTSMSLEPLTNQDGVEVEQLVFPPRLKDLGRWLIFSEISGEAEFELTYFTSGMSWRAFYMGTLSPDEQELHLSGYVRLSNRTGEEYEDAQTRLIVGEVNLLDRIDELAKRDQPYLRPGGNEDGDKDGNGVAIYRDFVLHWAFSGKEARRGEDFGVDKKQIVKEGLSEYFLYTLEGTETIRNGWDKRLESFEADPIPVVNKYKYDEARWGGQVTRFLTFTNDKDHQLGETPIPNGMVRVFTRVEEARLTYVGGTSIKYIPVEEEVELELGPARKVLIEPRLMSFATANTEFDDQGNIQGWDEVRDWDIEITNARSLPVNIEITRAFPTTYWRIEVDGDVPHTKHDATRVRFELPLAPRSTTTISYQVTTFHGTRETDR